MLEKKHEYCVGNFFSENIIFTKEDIIKQAIECGDHNFIHSDETRAEKTRFKSIIASGSAMSAIFSSMIPTYFSKTTNMLGLEMSFKFHAPIYVEISYTMKWTIDEIIVNSEKTDEILLLSGVIYDNTKAVQVTGSAKILLLDKL
jgi:acyl dehydratase